MSFELCLRPAQRADAPELARLCRDELERGLGWHWRAPALARLMARPEVEVAVLEVDEELAGFGALELGPDEAELVLFVIAPDYRRQGLGRELLAFLEEEASTAGAHTIWLHVRADNESAISFYEQVGFRHHSYLPSHYAGRYDAIRLKHELGSEVGRSAEPTDLAGLLRGKG